MCAARAAFSVDWVVCTSALMVLIHPGVSGEFPLWEGCFPWQGRQGGIRRS